MGSKKPEIETAVRGTATQTTTVKYPPQIARKRPTLRQQCGLAVMNLMIEKNISFSKMAKIAGLSHDKFWWYIIGDRRGSPQKDMDLLEKMGDFFGGWSGPRFIVPKETKKAKGKKL